LTDCKIIYIDKIIYGGKVIVNITDNARTVLEKRYLRRNENNEVIETVEQLFRRVADATGTPI
jgi:ribonucleoside-diphosphate reductase alpha chain